MSSRTYNLFMEARRSALAAATGRHGNRRAFTGRHHSLDLGAQQGLCRSRISGSEQGNIRHEDQFGAGRPRLKPRRPDCLRAVFEDGSHAHRPHHVKA